MTAFLRRSLHLAVASMCLLWFSALLPSQEYRFQYFGLDDGLGNLLIQSIYQDRSGFLWVSTQEGVFRYDGDRFRLYDKNYGLPLVSGASFAEASDGTLLVGSAGGLFQLAGNHFENLPLPGNPDVTWLHGMQSDGRGRTYIATTAGLMVLTGVRGSFSIHALPQPPAVNGREAWGIFLDGQNIWYGCGRQLCARSGDRVRVFGKSEGLPPAIWIPIGRDLEGQLWVQGRGADIRVLPRDGSIFRIGTGPLPANGFTGLPSTDGAGYILFPSPDGLAIRRKSDWWKVGRDSGLNGTAYSAYRDRQGSLWIGLEGQGLVRWSGYRAWEAYTPNSGFNSDIAYQILPRPDGSVWVATVAGLFRGKRQSGRYVWHKVEALGRTPVVSLAFDQTGKLWIGTEAMGLARLDPDTGTVRWLRKAGMSAVSISALLFDRQGRLWAATEGGLYTANSPYQTFRRVQSIPQSHFWTIAQSANGDIWAGADSGLYRSSGNAWSQYTTADGLSHSEVVALGAASDGSIWAGFRTGGEVDHIEMTSSGIKVAQDRHLAHAGAAIVYFLGFDTRGRMWAGTNRGVGVLQDSHWIHMNSDDGLVWDDCDGNGFAAAPDGSVWIGTSNGLAHFTPDAQLRGDQASGVVFTRIALGGKDVTASAERPTVDYLSNSFVVQYSSLDFIHGSTVTYRYRLLPLFSAWRTTARGELEFPGLPPGDYRLEVAVRDAGGQVNPPAAQFSFQVRTPWFRSWWFDAIIILAAFGLMVLIVRIRVAALKRHEAELMWLVEERTADLKLANEELYRLSSIDALTGIANRRVCDDLLRREWARMLRSGEPLSAMMLDVDHFKILNDVEGHQRGDEYLVRLAEELRSVVKRETDLAARYGGEEFIIVLPATNSPDAEEFAESLRARIETLALPHRGSLVAPVLTISIGVGTAVPNAFKDLSEFMMAIDRALYAAKGLGRNRVVAVAQMDRNQQGPESLPHSFLTARSGD
jgi:diguanylate cyclase (GGDEF)-like protein